MQVSFSKMSSLSEVYLQLAKKPLTNFHHFDNHFKEVLEVVKVMGIRRLRPKEFAGHPILIFTAKYKNRDNYLFFSVGASDVTNVDSEGNVHNLEIITSVACDASELPDMLNTVWSILFNTLTLPLNASPCYPETNVIHVATHSGEAKKIRYFGFLRNDDFEKRLPEEEDIPFLLTPFYITPDEVIEIMQGPGEKADIVNGAKLFTLMRTMINDDNTSAFIDYNRPSVDLTHVGNSGLRTE